MGRWAGALAATTLCMTALSACGSDTPSSHRRAPASTRPTVTSAPARGSQPTTPSTTTEPPPRTTTTTEGPNAFLQNLLAEGRHADVKVVYDTPSGRVTLIRRAGDTVYADGSGVRFHISGSSYDCTGSGDGATCTRVSGDATQSDVDAYTGLVADALAAAPLVQPHTTSYLGRTAECMVITGRPAARAGTIVDACIDDETGVLLRFGTEGRPDPGLKLLALSLSAPTNADFRIPSPPTNAG